MNTTKNLHVKLRATGVLINLLATQVVVFVVVGGRKNILSNSLYGLIGLILFGLLSLPYLLYPYITCLKHKAAYALSVLSQVLLVLATSPRSQGAVYRISISLLVLVGTLVNWGRFSNMFVCVTYSDVRYSNHHIPYQEILFSVISGMLFAIPLEGFHQSVWFRTPGQGVSTHLIHIILVYVSANRIMRQAICEWPNKTNWGQATPRGTFTRTALFPKNTISTEGDETGMMPDLRTWSATYDAALARRLVAAQVADDKSFRNPLRQQDVPITSDPRQSSAKLFAYEEDQEAMDIAMARRAHLAGGGLEDALPNEVEVAKAGLRKELNRREEALLDTFAAVREPLRPELIEKDVALVSPIVFNIVSLERNTLVEFVHANYLDHAVWNKRLPVASMRAEVFKITYHLTLDVLTSCLYYASFLDKDSAEFVSCVSSICAVLNGVNVFTRGETFGASLIASSNPNRPVLSQRGAGAGAGAGAANGGVGNTGGGNRGNSGGGGGAMGAAKSGAQGGGSNNTNNGGRKDDSGQGRGRFNQPPMGHYGGTQRRPEIGAVGLGTVDTMATINLHYNVSIEYDAPALPHYVPLPVEPLEKSSRLADLVDEVSEWVQLFCYKVRLQAQGLLRHSFADNPVVPTLLINLELMEPIIQNIASYSEAPGFGVDGVAPGNAPLAALVGVFLHSVNVLGGVASLALEQKLVDGALFARTLLVELRARRILALV